MEKSKIIFNTNSKERVNYYYNFNRCMACIFGFEKK